MRHISIHGFREVLIAEQGNSSIDFINVCTPAEYKEKHIEGVRNIPLDRIADHAKELQTKQTVYVHCRSGKRAAQAIEALKAAGVTAELVNVEGGLMAWDDAGLPTRAETKRIPLMRQVLLAAGVLILLSFVLGYFVHVYFLGLALGVGAGLTFAGATGWCGMSFLLAKMPWNN